MKALILAAGFGTRLLPHTRCIPKALFPVAGRPVIDLIIEHLTNDGIDDIIINTHHLHSDIEDYIRRQHYPVPVSTRFEKKILGTGGAIKNVSDFLGNHPFLMINSDILCNISLSALFKFHNDHGHPITLVMHDYPAFNKVRIDADGFVISFNGSPSSDSPYNQRLAFTGIQIIDPVMMEFIPDGQFISSIEVYERMMAAGYKIKTYVSKNHYWRDIGSLESFTEAAFENTSPAAFSKAFGITKPPQITKTLLAGDGSDRKWYRISSAGHSLVMADHGINSDKGISEIDSFISISNHLFSKGIPVPKIYDYDIFSGLVYMQDLGDVSLQATVNAEKNKIKVITLYKSVIDQLLNMNIHGAQSFNPSWTYQTPTYSKELILERECRYFVEAFLNGYLDIKNSYESLKDEFSNLADLALNYAVWGFMHRDFQSRNIMIKDNTVYFIDFQGGRIGPMQYDLASLLCDPYVDLPESLKSDLLHYCLDRVQNLITIDKRSFTLGYYFCSITRLLQALGAYGYLSRVKHKIYFESYIPIALINLKKRLDHPESAIFNRLQKTVEDALIRLNEIQKQPN